MNTGNHSIKVGRLKIDIVRKDIKNLHLAVYPPNGRIRIAVPLHISDDNVRLAIIKRLPWIKRQQKKLSDQPRQSVRRFVTGESHYYQGRRFRLYVDKSGNGCGVEIKNSKSITLYAKTDSSEEQRRHIMTEWYRMELKKILPPLIDKWQTVIGVELNDWRIKRMKTKWGSCNPAVGRIWLNLELAKKPITCLEYIIAHELVHLHEPTHNQVFINLMNKFMPNWRLYRDKLNSSPIAHEDWAY